MRIEFFPDKKVLLIYGAADGARALYNCVSALASEQAEVVAINELPGFEGIDGCELVFSVGKTDRGAWLRAAPNRIECSIRPVWWTNMAGLIEPFCQQSLTAGFQHLDAGFSSEISLVISTDRAW